MTVVELTRSPFARLRARLRASREAQPPMTTSAVMLASVIGILLGGGLIMILSSSWVSAYENYGSSFLYFTRQVTWALIGVAAFLTMARIHYGKTRAIGYLLLAGSIVGLIAVLIPGIGVRAGGASRWLSFGIVRVQPSEFAKLGLILVGAALLTRRGTSLRTFQDVLFPVGALAGLIGALVMFQPDLGTTLTIGGITLTLLYLAGARMRVLGGLGIAAIGVTTMLALTEGYRRARLTVFTNPFADPLNAGYQAVQSQIALGTGGLFGVGLGASRQKWLYVPSAHTDFIFSIIGEEMGLLGTFAVLALFAVFTWLGIRIARHAPDAYGRIVAGTITAWIAGQAFVNIGAVTGLLPITGIPLPLVSFGGSSLVITLAALGILMNIARHEQWPRPAGERASPA
jgi:cell division protein FtsW